MDEDFDALPGGDEYLDEEHLDGDHVEEDSKHRVRHRWKVAAAAANKAARDAEAATAKLFNEDSFFGDRGHRVSLIHNSSNMIAVDGNANDVKPAASAFRGAGERATVVAPLTRDRSGDMADQMLKDTGDTTHGLKRSSDVWRPHTPARWPTTWDFLVGTVRGKTLLLCGIAVALVGGGAVVWARLCGANRSGLSNAQFWEALWLSWGLFFDPGTQTGVEPDDFFAVKLVALALSVFGFVFNLTVLGVVVDAIRGLMDKWERTRSRLIYNGHTIILGWTDKTARSSSARSRAPTRIASSSSNDRAAHPRHPPLSAPPRSSSSSASCSRSSAGARSARGARASGGAG